jgi:hypothetical protein
MSTNEKQVNPMALAFQNALRADGSAPAVHTGNNEPVHMSRTGVEWGGLLANTADAAMQFAGEFRDMLRAADDWPVTKKLPLLKDLGAELERIRAAQPTEGPKALIRIPTLAEITTGVIARFDAVYMEPTCTRKGAAEWRRLVHASGETGGLRIALMSEDTLRAHKRTMTKVQTDALAALRIKVKDALRTQWRMILSSDIAYDAPESNARAVKTFAEALASKPVGDVVKFIGNTGRTVTPKFKAAINAYLKAMDAYAAEVMEAEAIKN